MSKLFFLMATTGILLQGCAGVVNPQGKGDHQVVDGSKSLSVSTKECQRGIGFVRLFRDTNDGSEIKYNAKFNFSAKNVDKEFNAYNMLGENNPANLPKGEQAKNKVSSDDTNNSILIKFSDKPVAGISSKVGDATKTLSNTDGTKTKINSRVSIDYDTVVKYYKGWGVVENAALSEADNDTLNQNIIQSVFVKLGKDETAFPIPETLDGKDLGFDQKMSATIGTPLVIKINPKTREGTGFLYVYLNNGLKGAKNISAKYIVDDKPGVAEITVPTKGMKKGDYVVNVFRSEIFLVDADEKTEGAQNFCMEVGTGIIGRLSVAEPEKKK